MLSHPVSNQGWGLGVVGLGFGVVCVFGGSVLFLGGLFAVLALGFVVVFFAVVEGFFEELGFGGFFGGCLWLCFGECEWWDGGE